MTEAEEAREDQPVRIRAAEPADLEVALSLIDALIAEDSGAHDTEANLDWAGRYGREHVTRIVEDDTRIALLAEIGDDAVGGLTGSILDPTPFQPVAIARLGSLYVRPAWRSRGVGADLVAAFLAWADNRGVPVTQVTAYADNTRAIAFYESQGLHPHELVLRRRSPQDDDEPQTAAADTSPFGQAGPRPA